MTREDRLYTMKGSDLIRVADGLGIKVACNRAHTKLTEAKDKVIARILAFEAQQAQEEEPAEEIAEELPAEFEETETFEPETLVEAPTEAEATTEDGTQDETEDEAEAETQEEETKKKPRAAKRENLKIKELTYHGETKTIKEWAAEIEMPWPTLYDRVNRNGWSTEEAIETPLGQRRKKA